MATNTTEWWSLRPFHVSNLRGVLTPFFRARDMAASTPITKQCFDDLALADFIIQALYGGGSGHMGSVTTCISRHVDKFNDVGMDGLENGDGQARAFGILIENLGEYVQDGYKHKDGVGAEETFAQNGLRLLSALGCEPKVLNKELRGQSVRKDKLTQSVVLYFSLYSRVSTPGTPRDLRKAAIDAGLLAIASGGARLGLSEPARQFVVEWFLNRGRSGGYGDCARELKVALPDEPLRPAGTIATVYRRLADRIPGLPQPGSALVIGSVAGLDAAGRADLAAALSARTCGGRFDGRALPRDGAELYVEFVDASGEVVGGGSGPQGMWRCVLRGGEVVGADPGADWVGDPYPFDPTARWVYASLASAAAEPASSPSSASPTATPPPPTPLNSASSASTTTTSPTAPPPASGFNKGRWSADEEALFEPAFQAECFGKQAGYQHRISAIVRTRSPEQVRTHAQKYLKKLEKQLAAPAPSSPTTTTPPPVAAASTKRALDADASAPPSKRKKALPPPFSLAAIRGRIIVFSGKVYIHGEHVTERQLRRLVEYLGGGVRDVISYKSDYVIAGDVNSEAYKVVNAASRGAIVVSGDDLSKLLTPEMFEKADAAYVAKLKAPVTKTLASLGELAGACIVVTGRDRELERMALCAKLRSCGATTKDKVGDVKKATFVVRCAFNAGVTMTEKLIEARSCGIPVVEVANLHALWRAAAPAPCAVAAPSPPRRALAENLAPSA